MAIRRSKRAAAIYALALVGSLAVLVLAARSATLPDALAIPVTEAVAAPDFRLTTTEREPVSRSALAGRVVCLHLWSPRCADCEASVPPLIDLHRRMRHRGLAVVGVPVDPVARPGSRPRIRGHRFPYPLAVASGAFLEAYHDRNVLPILIVLDRQGRLRKRLVGEHEPADVETLVTALLQE